MTLGNAGLAVQRQREVELSFGEAYSQEVRQRAGPIHADNNFSLGAPTADLSIPSNFRTGQTKVDRSPISRWRLTPAPNSDSNPTERK